MAAIEPRVSFDFSFWRASMVGPGTRETKPMAVKWLTTVDSDSRHQWQDTNIGQGHMQTIDWNVLKELLLVILGWTLKHFKRKLGKTPFIVA
jgi:hypothetical protein